MMAPLATKVKKVSPVTITLRSNRPATTRATVDFPAPGGPVTTMRSVTPANLEPSRRAGIGHFGAASLRVGRVNP